MSKKIVVITGSPRKKGNSFAMTEAFIKAAEKRGHTITRFDVAMMNVGGCRACETCFKTGKACSFNDDFNIIAPAIQDADAIVFSMPVYWLLSVKLDAPAPCRLDASDLDLICYASADCLHQHLQVI